MQEAFNRCNHDLEHTYSEIFHMTLKNLTMTSSKQKQILMVLWNIQFAFL